MKIDTSYQDLIQSLTKSKSQTSSETGSPKFADILGGLSAEQPANAFSRTQSAAGLMESGLVGRLMAEKAESPQNPQVQLEQTLSLLEEYASVLADPQKSLKDIGPMADQLGLEGERLSKVSQNLGLENPLKTLTNDTAVLATVEAMKFKRGDYL